MRLTDLTIKHLPCPLKGQKMHFDDALPGFGIRVSSRGVKSFCVVYGARRERVTIGRYSVISLAAARLRAKEILAENILGKRRPKSINFEDARTQFLLARQQKNRPRTVKDYTRILNRHGFGRTQLQDISTHDINKKLDALAHVPSEQHHAYVCLRIFFRWAKRRNYVAQNPMEGMEQPSQPRKATRKLSDKELAAVLSTAFKGTDHFSRIVALLALTGQRRGEISALQWPWLNTIDRSIVLPAAITKNKHEHTLPYGDMAAAVFERIPKLNNTTYLFPASREHVRGNATSTFNGWGKAKQAFDKQCGVTGWTLHTLRRNFSSGLASLGVAPHIINRLLNHISGSDAISGVSAVYNTYSYMPECRNALTLWDAHLAKLLESE